MGPGSTGATAHRFPVVWREGDGDPAVGELIVARDVLRFEGARGGAEAGAQIRFSDVRGVRVARRAPERRNGRPTIVIDRDTTPFYLEPVGAGLLGEIASLLTMLREKEARPTDHVAVIVPLRKGTESRAASLVALGPPFDLVGTGIRSHQVYVGGQEAIFVFGGPDVHDVLERTLADPALWRAGLAWRNVIAGRPRMLRCSFSWAAPVALDPA